MRACSPHHTLCRRCRRRRLHPAPGSAVDVAEPNYRLSVLYKEPDDEMYIPGPYSSGQWHLPAIQAPAAWGLMTGTHDVSLGGEGRWAGEPSRGHGCRACQWRSLAGALQGASLWPAWFAAGLASQHLAAAVFAATCRRRHVVAHASRRPPPLLQVGVCVIDTGSLAETHDDLIDNNFGGWNR